MVVDIEEGPGGMPKLACSMRAVDQESGQPLMSLQEAAQRRDLPHGPLSDPTAVPTLHVSPSTSCQWPAQPCQTQTFATRQQPSLPG